MIELKECCKVPFPEKLFEHYEVKENAIYANEDFDIFFIDGLGAEQACQCIDALGNFLIKDGMNTFGIGGHESHEEILFGKYNVMTLHTRNTEEYRIFLNDFEITETDTLLTAWDTFDQEHPGESTIYVSEKTGKTVCDIPETYKEYGMYLYESRKEYNEAYEKPITFEELIGKVLLVGITYYTQDNKFIEQKQFYGTVLEANESIIRIKQKDESEFYLPPDLSSTKRARPGEYRLRSPITLYFILANILKNYIKIQRCLLNPQHTPCIINLLQNL